MPRVSIFRIFRILRLVRLIRVVQWINVKDLMSMIHGLVGGLQTLGFAGFILGIIIYFVALLCRETLGRKNIDNISEYFDSVPRAFFTVCRCSFGDCSTASGLPLFEVVTEAYGSFYATVHAVYVFVLTVGVFNVVSAIFVESTMNAAHEQTTAIKAARLRDEELWSHNIMTLICGIVESAACEVKPLSTGGINPSTFDLTRFEGDIMSVEVAGNVFTDIIKDPHVMGALDALDISRSDHMYLHDILDPENDGHISVGEIVDGIQRLRGEPRRSDIVAVDLMVRCLQADMKNIISRLQAVDGCLKEQTVELQRLSRANGRKRKDVGGSTERADDMARVT